MRVCSRRPNHLALLGKLLKGNGRRTVRISIRVPATRWRKLVDEGMTAGQVGTGVNDHGSTITGENTVSGSGGRRTSWEERTREKKRYDRDTNRQALSGQNSRNESRGKRGKNDNPSSRRDTITGSPPDRRGRKARDTRVAGRTAQTRVFSTSNESGASSTAASASLPRVFHQMSFSRMRPVIGEINYAMARLRQTGLTKVLIDDSDIPHMCWVTEFTLRLRQRGWENEAWLATSFSKNDWPNPTLGGQESQRTMPLIRRNSMVNAWIREHTEAKIGPIPRSITKPFSVFAQR